MQINSSVLMLILIPGIVGIAFTIAVVKTQCKLAEPISLRSCAIRFGIAVGINLAFTIVTFGIGGSMSYALLCGPIMVFAFVLSKRLIARKEPANRALRMGVKGAALLLVWFFAFFPFSAIGVFYVMDIPERRAQQVLADQTRAEIEAYDTYADLSPYGLGIYKLKQDGFEYLWDVTQPVDYSRTIRSRGDDIIFIYSGKFNLRDKNFLDYESLGKDVQYDIFTHEDTFVIASPILDNPDVLGDTIHIYLCKAIAPDTDIFQIGITDPAIVEKLRALPGERISRREICERLGKPY